MAYNSTIISKKKNLSCGCYDFNFSKNRCRKHATIEDSIKRINEVKELNKIAVCSDTLRSTVESNDLDIWFVERRKEMTGFCKNCGGKSCKHDDKYFKFSIAHILPKAYFKSVATHPDNWLELCFFGSSCHTNYDTKMLDLMDMNCFDEIIIKFQKIYPAIDKKERKRIPELLLQYLNTDL